MTATCQRTLRIADLFCGAGGTSAGAVEAATSLGYRADITAINHWPLAVETHSVNHPGHRHLCASLDSLDPRSLYKPGELNILWASPECTHHSTARGGMPVNDQSRATAWCVVRWAEAIRPEVILVENVVEFRSWGPIGSNGRPLASRKGQTFHAWLAAIESLGYRVDHAVLRAADFGDPTTRQRLFVQATRGRRRPTWPDPTHSEAGGTDILGKTTLPWVPASSIIDWDIPGESLFERARPLKPKTIARIQSGLRRLGSAAEPFLAALDTVGQPTGRETREWTLPDPVTSSSTIPFLVTMRGTNCRQVEGSAHTIGSPLSTVTAGGIHHAIVVPTLLPQQSGGLLRPVTSPVPTVAAAGAIALVRPHLTKGSIPNDRRPLVIIEGETYRADILFRMLTPRELAAAQGFPSDYQFQGNREEVVRQIGNAVPRNLARAILASAWTGLSSASALVSDENLPLAA